MFIPNRRLKAVAVKEVREIRRSPLYLALAFAVPLIIEILFGYGLTLDVRNIPFAVADHSHSRASRDFLDRVQHSPYFHRKFNLDRFQELERLLQEGKVRTGLVFFPDFERRFYTSGDPEFQALIDGSFPDRAEAIRWYLEAITAEYNLALARRLAPGRPFPTIQVEPRAWFNPDLKSKNFIVPGLLVTTLTFYPALLASIAIVREKETGSILNVYISPIRPWEYVAGKLLPYLGIAFINYLFLFLMGDWLFNVPFRGSFIFLTGATVLFLLATTSLGLLMSTLFKTQVASMLLTTVITLIPAFIYSGFFISVNSMGPEAQFMAYILPPTYFMEIVRGIYLKGLGPTFYLPQLLALALFATAFLGLAVRRVRKRLD